MPPCETLPHKIWAQISVLSEFAVWWARQMLALVGGGSGEAGKGPRNALVIEALDTGFGVTRRRNGRERALFGRYHTDDAGLAQMQRALRGATRQAPVILRLPPHLLLEHQVTLPLLAERDLGRALGYEIDRLTPFTDAEVFWTFAVERRDRPAGLLRLRLSLVPRQDVQPLLALLARTSVVPAMLEVLLPSGQPRLIGLSRPSRSGLRSLSTGLAAACAILAVIAIGLPVIRQSRDLALTGKELAGLRPAIAQVEALRRRIAGKTAGADVIGAERGRVGDALGVLATVTDILPDDTFLSAFAMAQRKISLDGQAAGAARLIALLAADPTIRNPVFAAPVTRTAGGRADLFSIHAEIGP